MKYPAMTAIKCDIGNGGVKKINYANVKKILLFESRHSKGNEELMVNSRKFRIFRE